MQAERLGYCTLFADLDANDPDIVMTNSDDDGIFINDLAIITGDTIIKGSPDLQQLFCILDHMEFVSIVAASDFTLIIQNRGRIIHMNVRQFAQVRALPPSRIQIFYRHIVNGMRQTVA